ncbi:MAG: hypothetical protein ACXVCV_19515 [Polyangia bacterium]
MRALALTIMLLPSAVFAQAPAPLPAADDPGECTVTTTVRCTGAAAPYAVEAAKPQAPVVIQAPAPPPPPMMPPPGTVILDPRLLGDNWRVVQSADGCLWRERKVSTDSPALWGTGMAFWLGGYAASIIGGMQEGGVNLFGWWPIIGAFANTAFNSGGAQALWAIDGVAQTGGFVMFLVGLAAGPDKMQRMPLTVGAAGFAGGGSGIALSGRF